MRYHELLSEANIKSPRFQEWFKGSKVVDRLRAPLVCFHGTLVPYEIKPAGQQHFGTFAAADERIKEKIHSAEFSTGDVAPHIYPVYLNIKKPLMLDDNGEWEDADVISQLHERGLVDSQTLERFQAGEDPRSWIDICKSLGYDGVVYKNEYEDAGSLSWYPFSDHQVWNTLADHPY